MKRIDPRNFGQDVGQELRAIIEQRRRTRRAITLFLAAAATLAILAGGAILIEHRPIAALLGLGSYSSAVFAGAITLDR